MVVFDSHIKKNINLKVYRVFPVCGLVLSCIKRSSRGIYNNKKNRENTLTTTTTTTISLVYEEELGRCRERRSIRLGHRVLLGILRAGLRGGGGWVWREGPQVQSLSAMQMTCKSAHVSRRPQFESRPERYALSRSSRAFAPDSPTCSLSLGRLSPSHSVGPGTRLTASRHRQVGSRRRSEPCPGAARPPPERSLRALCLRSRAAFAARVSEPARRFCPGAAPGSQAPKVGVGGRDLLWKPTPLLCWRRVPTCSKELGQGAREGTTPGLQQSGFSLGR